MKKLVLAVSLFAVPLVASAAGEKLRDFLAFTQDILNTLIPILIAAALVAFFVGLVKYVWGGGGEGGGDGKKIMIAGLVSLFIMVSVWGIIRIAQNTLGVSSDRGGIQAPSVPPQGN